MGRSSFYLHALISLNFWETNFLFITVILLSFFTKTPLLIRSVYTLLLGKGISPWIFWLATTPLKTLITPLWVGTINIHPFLFYFSVCMLLIYVVYINLYNILNFKITISEIIFLLILALLFGGLWGLQSLTWGYIWVNDGIEWILFSLILYSLVKVHTLNVLNMKIYSALNLILIYCLLLYIRLNFVTTRHSFLSQQPLFYTIVNFLFIYTNILSINFTFFRVEIRQKQLIVVVCFILFYFTEFTGIAYGLKWFGFYAILVIWTKPFLFTAPALYINHLLLLTGTLIWSQYYTAYHIFFNSATLINYINILHYKTQYITNNLVTTTHKLLELVNLHSKVHTTTSFPLNTTTVYTLFFSNASILLFILCVYFLKDIEFRLLH